MARVRVNREWRVAPHGPLETIEPGLLTVAAEIRMPLGNFPRRMTVVVLSGGRVAIWSAVPLAEPEMKEIEALGEIAFLIVPGVAHRLDIAPWKQRYPQAKVVCTPGARQAVRKVVPVDATGDVLDDPEVELQTVPGVAGKEAALVIRRAGGTTIVLNDLLANVRHPRGIGAQIMARLMGFGVKRPQMPWVGRRMFVKDANVLAAAFRTWAHERGLRRIIVSHGDVIEKRPGAVLERIAGKLIR